MHDTGESNASIVDTASGQELFSAHTMDSIWVELAADSSAAHGPKLRIRLVSSRHPAVQQASIKAAYPLRLKGNQEPCEAAYPRRTEGQQEPSTMMADGQLSASVEKSKQPPHLHGRSQSVGETVLKPPLDGLEGAEGNSQNARAQKPAVLVLQKPRPGWKAKKAESEQESIAAVLDAVGSSLQADEQWNVSMAPASETRTTAESGHCPDQLVSGLSSPCVAFVEQGDRRMLLQGLWQLQLRIAKMSARADAALSLARSDRMKKLQTEMCDLYVEMRNVQEQLQVV